MTSFVLKACMRSNNTMFVTNSYIKKRILISSKTAIVIVSVTSTTSNNMYFNFRATIKTQCGPLILTDTARWDVLVLLHFGCSSSLAHCFVLLRRGCKSRRALGNVRPREFGEGSFDCWVYPCIALTPCFCLSSIVTDEDGRRDKGWDTLPKIVQNYQSFTYFYF